MYPDLIFLSDFQSFLLATTLVIVVLLLLTKTVKIVFVNLNKAEIKNKKNKIERLDES